MRNEPYNGWTNFETWLVHVWLDENSGNRWLDAAKEAKDVSDLSEQIKESVEDDAPQGNSLYTDLIGDALREVNWTEIAEFYIESVTNTVIVCENTFTGTPPEKA